MGDLLHGHRAKGVLLTWLTTAAREFWCQLREQVRPVQPPSYLSPATSRARELLTQPPPPTKRNWTRPRVTLGCCPALLIPTLPLPVIETIWWVKVNESVSYFLHGTNSNGPFLAIALSFALLGTDLKNKIPLLCINNKYLRISKYFGGPTQIFSIELMRTRFSFV